MDTGNRCRKSFIPQKAPIYQSLNSTVFGVSDVFKKMAQFVYFMPVKINLV
uniref:Uncharacterized protein n=1 Tax=Peromyscus leucopus gammaherpesvirus TaxID=3048761 RepID=A0A9Y1YSE2_9GAMA|nr:MAG: hypothetical protein ADFBMEEK_00088 [Peromyscus leucopus gammaherpesvirus]